MDNAVVSIRQFIESLSQFVFRFEDAETARFREEASGWIDANVNMDDDEVKHLFEVAQVSSLPLVVGYPLGFEEGEDALREISDFAARGYDWESWFRHFVAAEASGLQRWQAEQRGA